MPTRHLPTRPSIENLRNQAKRLLREYRAGVSDARKRLMEHPRWEAISVRGVTLSDAQLALAREYGYADWEALLRHVQQSRGAERDTQRRLVAMPSDERSAWLMAALRAQAAERLGVQQHELTPGTPFADFDPSLANRWALAEFQADILCAALGTTYEPLPGTPLSTLRELVEYLTSEYEATRPPDASASFTDPCEGGRWAWRLPTDRSDGLRRNRKMVFILSSARSGSTLLRVMLTGHPTLFAPPELFLLSHETMGQKRARTEPLHHSWMNWGLGRALAELRGVTEDEGRTEVERLTDDDTPIQDVYGLLQGLVGDGMLVDKTAEYAMHPRWMERAEEMFEEPLYIQLVRHPYATMESFVRMRLHRVLDHAGGAWGIRDKNLWRFAEKWWGASHRNIQEFLRHIPQSRQCRVLYEKLIAHPHAEMQRVCALLGVPFDDAVVTPYHGERMADGLGDPNLPSRTEIDSRLATAWQEGPRPATLSAFTLGVANELGYVV